MNPNEEIVYELIIPDLLKKSRSVKNWQRWEQKRLHKKSPADPLIQRLKSYWVNRYTKDSASRNFIKLVWHEWKIRNGVTPESALIYQKKELEKLKIDPIVNELRIKNLEKDISILERNIQNDPNSIPIKVNYPSVNTMAKTFAESMLDWAKKGFKVVTEQQFNQRFDICKGCELWDKDALGGTGRCIQCGCSTQAKLRIATEKCPVEKWGPVINNDQPTV